jgi:hypothetical protein
MTDIGIDAVKRKVNVYVPSLMMKVPDHLYVLGDTYTCHMLLKVQPIRIKICDMYMCSLRHINDPVLSSLKMEVIRFIFFKLYK